MAKTTRLIEIWFYINNKCFFTAQELADEFEVSLRTIQRDLMELTLMGVPFYSKSGQSGGYYMQHSKMVPPIIFSFEEVLSLLITYDTLENYIDNPYQVETTSIQDKLLNKLSQNNIDEYHTIKEYLTMWHHPHHYASHYTREILDCSINKQQMEMTYNSSGVTTKRLLAPLGLYGQNGLWYFPAYDYDKGDIRLFRCDRVLKVEALKTHNLNLVSLKEWLSYDYQFKDGLLIDVRVTTKGMITLNRVLDLADVEVVDGYAHYQGKIRNNDLTFMAMEFVKAQSDIEVLGPQILIDEMKRVAQQMIEHFNDTYGGLAIKE